MGGLIKFLVRKGIFSLTVLLGSTIIAFLLGVIAPGDPAREILSQNGALEPTEEQIIELRRELGLDQPLHVQYKNWVVQVLQGDLGTSFITNEPVLEELLYRLPLTLNLSIWAVLIASIAGIPFGIWMGARQNRFIDHIGRALSLILLSTPAFLLALLFIYFFAEKWGILPTSGYGSWQQMILPSVVLATGTAAILMRLTRAFMLEVINEAYILTARAKGLKEWRVIVFHALKNILIPLITVIGTYFGSVLGGSVIVEVIFAIPGVGRYAVEGIYRRDYPVIQGYVLFTTSIFILFNFITDFLYAVIHPEVRVGRSKQ